MREIIWIIGAILCGVILIADSYVYGIWYQPMVTICFGISIFALVKK